MEKLTTVLENKKESAGCVYVLHSTSHDIIQSKCKDLGFSTCTLEGDADHLMDLFKKMLTHFDICEMLSNRRRVIIADDVEVSLDLIDLFGSIPKPLRKAITIFINPHFSCKKTGEAFYKYVDESFQFETLAHSNDMDECFASMQDIVHTLFTQYVDSSRMYNIVSFEPTVLPLMLYDNLFVHLKKQKIDIKFYHITNVFITAYLMEHHMQYLIESPCHCIPSYMKCRIINMTFKKPCKKTLQPKYKNTYILTKIALHYNHRKRLLQSMDQIGVSADAFHLLFENDQQLQKIKQRKTVNDIDHVMACHGLALRHLQI